MSEERNSPRMWRYAVGREQRGPVDEAGMGELAASGEIGPRTLVWRKGLADWTLAGNTELAVFFSTQDQLRDDPAKLHEAQRLMRLWRLLLLSFPLLLILLIVLVLILILIVELGGGEDEIYYLGLGPFAAVILLFLTAVWVFVLKHLLLFQLWDRIQGISARTTPEKAIGFLLIPLFNLYWVFVAVHDLAVDMNKALRASGVGDVRVKEGMALAASILFILCFAPGVGFLAAIAELIVMVLLLRNMAEAAGKLVLARPEPPAPPRGLGFILMLMTLSIIVVVLIYASLFSWTESI